MAPSRWVLMRSVLEGCRKMTMAQAKYLQLTGNSVTGKEAAEMGWVAKAFPADSLEENVMR